MYIISLNQTSEKCLLIAKYISSFRSRFIESSLCVAYVVSFTIYLQAPDYYEIIKNPMDLGTIMSKIDLHRYQTVKAFLDDINRICSNALEYNPDKTPAGNTVLLHGKL